MRRTPFAVLTAFLLTLFVAVVPAVPAQAQGDERITAYNVNATLDRDGDARVTLDLTYDFADADRHGPYLTFVTRQSLTDDPGHVRHVTYSDIHASSPSGAPANLHEENGGALQLRIGSKDRTVTGTQKYRITYMVHGLIGRDNKESHLDEINWRIFTNVDVPVDNSKVTITAPVNVTRVYCEVEDGECDTSSTGTKTVTFSARKIDANTTWRVVAGVPAGTFTSAADATVTEESEVTSGSRADLPQYITVIPYIVAVVALGLIGLGASLFRKRDMEFAEEAPGFIPAPDLQQVRRRRGKVEGPILVHPPAGITPAQAGALLDGNADTNTVTAGMLDLVARHHLSINQEEPSGLVFKKPEWRFNWLRGEDSLAPWEARLLGSLIGSGNSITTRELRRQNGNIALPNAKKDLDELNDQAGYFTKSHRQARLGIVAIGVALIILGILGFVSGFPFLLGGGSAIVYFVLTFVTFVAGILFLGLSRKVRPPRSALGTAMTDQVRGFRDYLATIEAEQIQIEEDLDIFSAYLSWAAAFGIVDRWVTLFEQLEAEGRWSPDPMWYPLYGYGYGYHHNQSFASAFNDMTEAMSSSMTAAASSSTSSSSSGFSSVSSGGFGGGGGGSW